MIELENVSKTFTLHTQGGKRIAAVTGASFAVAPGECVALTGPSGAGKSTVMRMIWGNYLAEGGRIRVCGQDVAGADPRAVLALRRGAMGYVSQFLRVTPRTPALTVVAEPLMATGVAAAEAEAKAAALLARLNLPEALWSLSPMTFSGGEQQRVNIARGFIAPKRALLLDEPTASLDPVNRGVALELIEEAKAAGTAVLGIFHDAGARARVCDREIDVGAFAPTSEGLAAAGGEAAAAGGEAAV